MFEASLGDLARSCLRMENTRGWVCVSVSHSPTMCEALGSIPSTEERKERRQERRKAGSEVGVGRGWG